MVSQVEALPKDWQINKLVDLASKVKFAIVDGPFGSQLKVSEFTNMGIPLIEMQHLKSSSLDINFRRYITKQKYEELKRSAVKANDIVISKTGTLGLIAIVPEIIEQAMITSRLAKITLNQNMHIVFSYTMPFYFFVILVTGNQLGKGQQ